MRPLIQEAMRDTFPLAEERVAAFYAMQEYHLGWRNLALQAEFAETGKLLRPQLVVLAAQAVGGDMQQALPLAAGIQLIHDFSLIHDDIEDNSATRRGRTTVWKAWGLAQGINTGDGMFVIAHLALHRLSDTGLEPSIVLDVLRQFDQTILTICEGQYLDLSFEGRLDITEADYLAMISRKTAALIAAAAGLGARVGGATPSEVQAMFDFGHALGMAFQMQDDILGIWGKPDVTGKPYAADIYQRKVSLPIIYALQHAEQRAELVRIYQQQVGDDRDVEQALAILGTTAARAHTEQAADTYHEQAIRAIKRIAAAPDSTASTALQQIEWIARNLLRRET
ncbi:MAG: polyprenyl synthetase family protein [Chloroflexaceae bacterium]|nr:polyprenyl synthetase family protein [Chloroflexaceae bacterium]